ARLWLSWSTPEGKPERRAPERSVGSLVALMEHAGRETRATSPRAIDRLACGSHGARRKGNQRDGPPSSRSARLWLSWSTPEGKPERRAPERSIGSFVALMEHAGRETRASSPRAIGRLACGSHGARRKGNPSVEPPSDRSARLWLSWSTLEG